MNTPTPILPIPDDTLWKSFHRSFTLKNGFSPHKRDKLHLEYLYWFTRGVINGVAHVAAEKLVVPDLGVDLEPKSNHRLAAAFERANTAGWRDRERILDALDEVRNLSDEIHGCLERSRQGEDCLRQATVAIGELEVIIRSLWPDMGIPVSPPTVATPDTSPPAAPPARSC